MTTQSSGAQELGELDAETAADQQGFQAHIYDGGRCIFCGVNDLDDGIYGPFDCIERGQFTYTTETPESEPQS